jgi:hypothetical protein
MDRLTHEDLESLLVLYSAPPATKRAHAVYAGDVALDLRDARTERDQLSAENERLRGKERDDLRECVRVGHKCHIQNAEQTHTIQWMLGKLEDKCAEWASSYSTLYARAEAAERERDEAQAHARHWREAAVKENERAMEHLNAVAESQAHAADLRAALDLASHRAKKGRD